MCARAISRAASGARSDAAASIAGAISIADASRPDRAEPAASNSRISGRASMRRKMGSQPSASSPVSSTFRGPIDASITGTVERGGSSLSRNPRSRNTLPS